MVHNNRLDALLNEHKGNFFEYLVSISFSKKINKESEFLAELSNSYYEMLEQQELFIRNYYPYLIEELPILANEAVDYFLKNMNLSYDQVILAGKSLSATQDSHFKEADILLKEGNDVLPISLKMAKNSSFVNTKSGGVKSFFEKYFGVNEGQTSFNEMFENEFEKFAIELYSARGLIYDGSFKQWENEGFETLPGELIEENRKSLLSFYKVVNKEIFRLLEVLSKKDLQNFLEGVKKISGNSSQELVQLICYSTVKNDKLEKKSIQVIQGLNSLKLMELRENSGSVDIILDKFTLQVRLKPMNKFTSKAYKINCAIKYIN